MRRTGLICILLVAVTAAVYWPVVTAEFVNCDDPVYVSQNARVLQGLTGANVLWAFTTLEAEFWHPLTWLSHMLDAQLYGAKSPGHHLNNLLFHLANTLLLFLFLRRTTSALWRSAAVAGFFALHPLHVESVAWVAERKDVLSTFFFLLTVWFYVGYAKTRAANSNFDFRNYLLALLFFALGLMSKPMVVTLPFVLLLLDYWPLRRLQFASPVPSSKKGKKSSRSANGLSAAVPLRRLIVEKAPFFLLTLVGSAIAFIAEKKGESLASLAEFSIGTRFVNVLVSYAGYLCKTIWPVDLGLFYSHPASWPLWQLAGSLILLAGISLIVILKARTQPAWLVGWLWYLGTLVPVIGIVQIGAFLMPDRYTYIPLIGIFIMLVWGIAELSASVKKWRFVLICATAAAFIGCAAGTWTQIKYWQSSEKLFRHAVRISPESAIAHNNLGGALSDRREYQEAMFHFGEAVRLQPGYPMARCNLAALLAAQGRVEEAASHYEQALKIQSKYPEAHYAWAIMLARYGKPREAETHYREALRLRPDYFEANLYLGNLLVSQGRTDEALPLYRTALKIRRDSAEARHFLGNALGEKGDLENAKKEYAEALRLRPDYMEARVSFGNLLALHGEPDEAVKQYETVIRIRPDNGDAHYFLASLLARQKKWAEAVDHFRLAMKFRPDDPTVLRDFAWIMATEGDEKIYNPREAVTLAERAVEITGHRDATCLETLGAALSENGRLEDAMKTTEQALRAAVADNDLDLAAQIGKRLKHYREGRSYRNIPAETK